MCERRDAQLAQNAAADALTAVCTVLCPDLIRNPATLSLLPETADSAAIADLLEQLSREVRK